MIYHGGLIWVVSVTVCVCVCASVPLCLCASVSLCAHILDRARIQGGESTPQLNMDNYPKETYTGDL